MLKGNKNKIAPDIEPACDQSKVVEIPSHYLLHCKPSEELRKKIMKNITYIFNASGTTFKNTIAELFSEH